MRQPTLAAALWPTGGPARNAVLTVAGAALFWLSAKIDVPFYPVPMTLQTFAILTLAMAYGWRLGGATVLLYLAVGALGLPVFAGTPEKGIGIAYMTGSTGGYLLGFLLGALFVGRLGAKGWDRNVLKTLAAMLGGTALILVPGVLWLGVLHGWDKPILQWGLTPFLWGAAFKCALSAIVLPLAWKVCGQAQN